MSSFCIRPLLLALWVQILLGAQALADVDVQLTGVPDYDWQYGCFGTGSGNLMGYWDRHGFPDCYTGPTAGGAAPLRNNSTNAGIRSLWATQAGFDGRPAGVYGHVDDYWFDYANTGTDRYILSNRTEHVADCIGDFIGLSQKRWTNMNNECDGNIDAYAFVHWATNGTRRVNFQPPPQGAIEVKDIPSGLRAWTRSRGYEADAFSQLVSFNPNCPAGQGFRFDHVKAEIDAGYPLLAFLQRYTVNSRSLAGMPKANPEIHAMLIYGYFIYGTVTNVYVRDGYGGGEQYRRWSSGSWVTFSTLPVRGVIGYHPKPRVRSVSTTGSEVTIAWDGPSSELYDDLSGAYWPVHFYQLEKSLTLNPAEFQEVGPVTSGRTITVPDVAGSCAYYRVRLLP